MENDSGVVDVEMLFEEKEAVQPARLKKFFDRNGVMLVRKQEWDALKQLKEKAGHFVMEISRLETANRSLTEELTLEKTSNKEKTETEKTRLSAAIKSISGASKYPVKNETVNLLSYEYLNGLQGHVEHLALNSRLGSSRHFNPETSAPEPEPPTETSSIGDAQPGDLNQNLTAEPPASAAENNVPGSSKSSQVSLELVKTEVSQGTTTGPPESALLPASNDGVPLVAPISTAVPHVTPNPTRVPFVAPNPTGVNAPTLREDRPGTDMEPGVNLGPRDGSGPSSANGTRTGRPSSGSGDEQAQTPLPEVSPSGSTGSMFEEVRLPSQEARRMLHKRKFKDDEDQTGSGAHLKPPVVQLQKQSKSTGKKFKCQEVGCGKTYRYLGYLNNHYLNVHNLDKLPGQFGCSHCGRTFGTQAERKSHGVSCTVEH